MDEMPCNWRTIAPTVEVAQPIRALSNQHRIAEAQNFISYQQEVSQTTAVESICADGLQFPAVELHDHAADCVEAYRWYWYQQN